MKKLGKIALLLIVPSALILFFYFLIRYDGVLDFENPLAIITVILFVLLTLQPIFYTINVFRNTTVAKDQRALWLLCFYLFNFIATTIYWYRHIWKDNGRAQEIQEPLIPIRPILGIQRRMSKTKKLLLLALNFLPIVFFFVAVFLFIFTEFDEDSPLLITVAVLFFVSYFGLIVFNIADVYRNQSVSSNDRSLWVLVLIFGNIIAYPFYWYTHIWKEPQVESEITRETVITGG